MQGHANTRPDLPFTPNQFWGAAGFPAWVSIGWAPVEFFVTESKTSDSKHRRDAFLKFCSQHGVPRKKINGGSTLIHIQSLIDKTPTQGDGHE